MTATTCSANTLFDTGLEVFCDGCDSLACVDGNDDDLSCGSSTTSSTVSWCSDRDQVYFVLLGTSSGESGAFELLVTDDGSSCGTPDGCPLKTGACSVADVCQATNTHDECDIMGGTWVVDEDCATYICAAPPPITVGATTEPGSSGDGESELRVAPEYPGGPTRPLHSIDKRR